MKHFLITLFLLFSLPLQAWNESDHLAMTRLALEEVSREWGLDRPLEIHPLQSFLNKVKIRPDLGDTWHWADYLKVNTKTDFEHLPQGLRKPSALDVVVLAAIDPDDGRDQNLFVRDSKGNPHYAYRDQRWFGAMQGGDSQAFRHIEKPPFSWRHPIRTFGFPFRSVGEASERTEIYFQASLLAFSLQEDYWGWRFLGGALHYLEDLHQPYHAGQITPVLVLRGLWGYLLWGRTRFGLLGTFSHLVSNSHRFFESYVAISSQKDAKKTALDRLRGKNYLEISSQPGSVQKLAIQVRDGSNKFFPKLVSLVTKITEPTLQGPYRFKSDGEGADSPDRFLKKDPRLEQAYQKIFEITQNRFESAGLTIRSVVYSSLKRKETDPPEKLLQELTALLYPTSS